MGMARARSPKAGQVGEAHAVTGGPRPLATTPSSSGSMVVVGQDPDVGGAGVAGPLGDVVGPRLGRRLVGLHAARGRGTRARSRPDSASTRSRSPVRSGCSSSRSRTWTTVTSPPRPAAGRARSAHSAGEAGRTPPTVRPGRAGPGQEVAHARGRTRVSPSASSSSSIWRRAWAAWRPVKRGAGRSSGNVWTVTKRRGARGRRTGRWPPPAGPPGAAWPPAIDADACRRGGARVRSSSAS